MNELSNHKEERVMKSNSKSNKGKQVVNVRTELNDLPSFILQNIIRRLPVKNILCCKCVCKDWIKLIVEKNFSKLHHANAPICPIFRSIEPKTWPSDLHLLEVTNVDDLLSPLKLHSKISPPPVPQIPVLPTTMAPNRTKFGIVNSCNGLFCVCTTPFNNPIYVCNPITGEYIMLPNPTKEHLDDGFYIMQMENDTTGEMSLQDFVVSGFGYSQRSEEYKVMRILELKVDDDTNVHIQVLTLGTKEWRTVDKLDEWSEIGLNMKASRRLTLIPTEVPYKPSVCVYNDGNVHWLGNSDISQVNIWYMNFDNEALGLIQPPSQIYDKDEELLEMGSFGLGVLNGCLCLSDSTNYTRFKLWVLKDSRDSLSWTIELVIRTRSLTIRPRGFFQPIKYLANGDLLMFHTFASALVCYNPKDQSFRCFKIRGIESEFDMVLHLPSLVSMEEIIEVKDRSVRIKRKSRRLPANAWIEKDPFLLVEEGAHAVSAGAHSGTV